MVLIKKKFYITQDKGGKVYSFEFDNNEVLVFNRAGEQVGNSSWPSFYDAHMDSSVALRFDGIDAAEAVLKFLRMNGAITNEGSDIGV